MTCEACTAAEQDPRTGLYQAHCPDCKVRMVANGLHLFEASKAGRMTPGYRKELERLFGDDWEGAHLRVKAWRERIKGKQC